MLAVEINRANYEYDIHSLVKAFYPQEQVKVLTPETKQEKRTQLEERIGIRVEITGEGACVRADKALVSRTEEGEGMAQPLKEKASQQEAVQDYQKLPGQSEEAQEAVYYWRYLPENGSFKDDFKRFFYRCLQRFSGKSLPWGNLTGIRPTKLAYGMLEEGKKDEEILGTLQAKHYVSEEKAVLSLDIARRERRLLSGVHYESGYSLYIGIPFCPTTCLYCSFTSFPIGGYRKLTDQYVDCVIKELEFVAQRYRDKLPDSVYIGGGTPTTLEPEQLDRLLGAVRRLLDLTGIQEFTVEAGRPDSITREKLEALHRHGVTRISINPQTMKQATLDIIGRRHTVEQTEQAYTLARGTGFDNINMDLILGLPGETAQDVQHTIDRVVELAPDSLTVHSLAVKRASRLSQWILENGISMLNNTDETMKIAAEGARRLGMVPYYLYRQKNMSGNFENVGYAREDKLGLYNILIMEERQTIVALGAGSITKVVLPDGRIERCDNVKDVALYIEKIDEMIERKRRLMALEEQYAGMHPHDYAAPCPDGY